LFAQPLRIAAVVGSIPFCQALALRVRPGSATATFQKDDQHIRLIRGRGYLGGPLQPEAPENAAGGFLAGQACCMCRPGFLFFTGIEISPEQ
jgi:hypothetical protein